MEVDAVEVKMHNKNNLPYSIRVWFAPGVAILTEA